WEAGDPWETRGPGRDGLGNRMGAAVAGVALVEREIELAALEIAREPHAQAAAYVEPQARPRTGEVGEHVGEPVGGEILRQAEPHHAVAHRPRDNVARLLGEREDAARIGQEPLALLGRRRLAAVAVQ